jgi:hypothetical protein
MLRLNLPQQRVGSLANIPLKFAQDSEYFKQFFPSGHFFFVFPQNVKLRTI